MIDPHVHLRGEEYSTNYMELGFRDAIRSGLLAIIEQPNPTPQILTADIGAERLKRGNKYRGNIVHRFHIGITNDENQVRQALESVMKREHGLISDKIFYVHSTADMGILDQDFQRRIWQIKAEIGYKGVSIGHFEDELLFVKEYDPNDPITHSQRQNPESELIQVERQIRNAVDAGFEGIFYVAHASNPYTVYFLNGIKDKVPFEIAIEVTWHHMFLNTNDYEIHRNRVKMNPPLCSPKMQEKLLECVVSGQTHTAGSDHAPHPLERKDDPAKPASGIPGIPFSPKGIELLREAGIREQVLEDITFNNANRIFNMGLVNKKEEARYDPILWEAYGYNPFSRIDSS